VFGATTFWVTDTRPLAMQSLELGVVVRGNLRGPREVVFKEVCEKVNALFGERRWAGSGLWVMIAAAAQEPVWAGRLSPHSL
jgi:hypothetical protein